MQPVIINHSANGLGSLKNKPITSFTVFACLYIYIYNVFVIKLFLNNRQKFHLFILFFGRVDGGVPQNTCTFHREKYLELIDLGNK